MIQNQQEPETAKKLVQKSAQKPARRKGQLEQEYQLIDRVLEGQPEEAKQKVWEFVGRFGIHPDDEAFWALFVAMGYLQHLITESPEQWTSLFHSFQEELRTWTESNNKTLKLLAEKTEVMQLLSNSSEKLENVLFRLSDETHNLMLTLQQQTITLNGVLLQLKSLQETGSTVKEREFQQQTLQQLGSVQEHLALLRKDHQHLNGRLKTIASAKRSRCLPFLLTVAVMVVVFTNGLLLVRSYRVSPSNASFYAEWLMELFLKGTD